LPIDPAQPGPHPPPLPDEADLLAWVEGEPLPRDKEAAVRRAMIDDQGLARRLEGMRADRAALRSLTAVSAPASLMASVEAALQPVLERQMLLGLREGQPIEDHPPISIVRPMRRSIAQTFFADRMGRRLAMAAGLLLIVGGTAYLGTTYLSGKTAPRPINTLAVTKPRTDSAPPSASTPAALTDAAPAKTGETAAPTAARVAERDAAVEQAKTEPDEGMTIANAEPPAPEYSPADMGPFLPALDGARAAELAQDGRLVIRLKSVDPTVTSNPGRIAERLRSGDGWRLGDDPSPALLTLIAPPAAPAPEAEPVPVPELPTVAQTDPEQPQPVYGPPGPPSDWHPLPPTTVYLVQARLDGATLEALRSALAGSYGEAVYEEQAEPLPQEGPGAVNPASVVWWASGPSGWARWANVPVVVDTAR
jgi:hypothetical protein